MAAGAGSWVAQHGSSKAKQVCLTMIQRSLNHRGRDERAPALDRINGHPADRREVVGDNPFDLVIPLALSALPVYW